MIQQRSVRVVVAQGYCFLRNALVQRLEGEPWIEVCAVASEREEMRQWIELYQPHVLVINMSLKCSAGAPSLKSLKRDFPGLAIVALSCDSELENLFVGQALQAGADGYISAVDSPEELVQAIRVTQGGGQFLSRRTELHGKKNLERGGVFDFLSPREAEVFCLTGCGYTSQGIAERMGVSVKTVESCRERVRKKMKLASGADLLYTSTSFMRNAARRGIKEVDDEVVEELLSRPMGIGQSRRT